MVRLLPLVLSIALGGCGVFPGWSGKPKGGDTYRRIASELGREADSSRTASDGRSMVEWYGFGERVWVRAIFPKNGRLEGISVLEAGREIHRVDPVQADEVAIFSNAFEKR